MNQNSTSNSATAYLSRLLAQGIILMWALWLSIVSFTDFCNLLVGFGLLPTNFPASSHNLGLIYKYFKLYNLDNPTFCITVFAIINIWVLIIACLYWRALFSYYTNRTRYVYRVMQAFLANMSLFVCFLIVDEIFIQYQASHSHMNMLLYIFTSLVTFLYLLHNE